MSLSREFFHMIVLKDTIMHASIHFSSVRLHKSQKRIVQSTKILRVMCSLLPYLSLLLSVAKQNHITTR